jgi:hypothetical protein
MVGVRPAPRVNPSLSYKNLYPPLRERSVAELVLDPEVGLLGVVVRVEEVEGRADAVVRLPRQEQRVPDPRGRRRCRGGASAARGTPRRRRSRPGRSSGRPRRSRSNGTPSRTGCRRRRGAPRPTCSPRGDPLAEGGLARSRGRTGSRRRTSRRARGRTGPSARGRGDPDEVAERPERPPGEAGVVGVVDERALVRGLLELPEVHVLHLQADRSDAGDVRGVGERALRESKIQSM